MPAARLRALIFDMDGTLADTERDGHRIAFNAAFRDFGLDWEWDVATYGELLAVGGGKERIAHYIARHRRTSGNRTCPNSSPGCTRPRRGISRKSCARVTSRCAPVSRG